MPPDRIDKIKALLVSPVEGERTAALAALERVSPPIKPQSGSPEWFEAVNEWVAKIQWCMSQITSPVLSADDLKLIKNFAKYRGDPWCIAANDLLAVYSKLKAREPDAK